MELEQIKLSGNVTLGGRDILYARDYSTVCGSRKMYEDDAIADIRASRRFGLDATSSRDIVVEQLRVSEHNPLWRRRVVPPADF